MREILFLAHRIPYPPNKGDKIRSWNFLAHLAEHNRVHLGCFIDDDHDRQYVARLEALCGETHFATLIPARARMRSLMGLIEGAPLTLPYYRNAGLESWVDGIIAKQGISHIFAYSSSMAQYAMRPGAANARRIVDFVDVDSDKWRQYAETMTWPRRSIFRREYRELLAYERQIADEFDASVLVSPAEADLFRELVPADAHKVFDVSNGVDSVFFTPEGEYPDPFDGAGNVLVFTGMMDYRPNIDAVTWFAREIFPGIRRGVPTAQFYVVGASPTAEVEALSALPGVSVTGRVEDVRPYIAHASLFVAPLRISRGIQNKVLEGMAMAKPVVATHQALEGIDAALDKEIVLAADVAAFVASVLRLLASPETCGAIGSAARARVMADFAWPAMLARLDQIFDGSTIEDPAHLGVGAAAQ